MIPAWRTWRRGDFIGVFTTADREGDSCGIGELRDDETRAGEAEASFLRRSEGILGDYLLQFFFGRITSDSTLFLKRWADE